MSLDDQKYWNFVSFMSTICNKNNNEYIGEGNTSNKYVNIIKIVDNIDPCSVYNPRSGILSNNKLQVSNVYIDTSNPEILEYYLNQIRTNYKAVYNCLILSGHGYTWYPDALLKTFNRNLGINTFMPVTTNQYYTIRSKSSLASSLNNLGKVDILLFDTCAGMCVENLYSLRQSCDIFIGNMDHTGWKGTDEKKISDYLKNGDFYTPWNLSKIIVDNFSPQLDGNLNYAISAYKTIIGESVRSLICYLSNSLINWINEDTYKNIKIIKVIRESFTYPDYNTGSGGNGAIDNLSIDLLKMCSELSKYVDSIEIKNICKLLLIVLTNEQNVYKKTSDAFKDLSCLSIYFPLEYNEYMEKTLTDYKVSYGKVYSNIPFNKDSMNLKQKSWSTFLDVYYMNNY
jgi:hypothetical protein